MCRRSPDAHVQIILDIVQARQGLKGGLTSSVEVFSGVFPRQGERQRDGAQQLDDVGDVI